MEVGREAGREASDSLCVFEMTGIDYTPSVLVREIQTFYLHH